MRMQKGGAFKLEILGLNSLPGVKPKDDLAGLIAEAVEKNGVGLKAGDVVVVAQKVISKSEGCLVRLRDVKPSALAREWARKRDTDPRLVEVVFRESKRIVRMSPRVLITETRHGFVCANAGVDRSNVSGKGWVTCLPRDPDKSARRLARGLRRLLKASVAVIITDTFGRPWRLGQTNVAIGAAGLQPLVDLRGARDTFGRTLHATVLAIADELAAAAGLAMGKRGQVPVVIIRGYRYRAGNEGARTLIRPAADDLFR
jgi:coenzyme F420-0:L-glutamate ligase / coenzyme F420-1:gamma-L-glutamate ligase